MEITGYVKVNSIIPHDNNKVLIILILHGLQGVEGIVRLAM